MSVIKISEKRYNYRAFVRGSINELVALQTYGFATTVIYERIQKHIPGFKLPVFQVYLAQLSKSANQEVVSGLVSKLKSGETTLETLLFPSK